MFEGLLAYLAIGAVVGFFAGLLGIGGGAIMVPLLVLIFDAQGLPREQVLHLAVGTAMSTILFTSLSSIRSHHRRGSIRWDIFRGMTPGILAGGLAGSAIASIVPAGVLAIGFTLVIFFAATNILLERKPHPSRSLPGAAGLFGVGAGISALSAVAALGGAFISVPYMLWCNVAMLQAVGTAASLGFPIAIAGTAGYVYNGLRDSGLPPLTLGYIYLPALAGIVVTSMLFAPLGAAAAHRLPTQWLKRIYAVLLYVLAVRMLIKVW
jgi:uncharacterized membrane protein YfcA